MRKNVTFPIAKLLKEKGFNEPCEDRFDENGIPTATKLGMHMHPNNYSDSYSAPLISDVVDWLLEKHSIWIFCDRTTTWFWTIQKSTGEYIHHEDQEPLTDEICKGFNSPKEAYLAAIEYTLTEII